MNKVLITSQGRTATLSLNQGLDKIGGVCSFHERRSTDVPFLFYSQQDQYRTITQDYLKEEDAFASTQDQAHFVAVNPYFRFVGQQLRDNFGWQVAHLVRHPKTYLESVFQRSIFTRDDKGLHQLPQDNDNFSTQWNNATRFEKLCWYYAKTLSYFAQTDIQWFQYETVVAHPSGLNNLLTAVGLPEVPADFELPRTNAGPSIKTKLIRTLRNQQIPAPLDWGELTTREQETYASFFEPLASYFKYDL